MESCKEGESMNINGIEYFVTLFLGDLCSEQVQEINFSDFYEMNRFIQNNKNKPEYTEQELNYSLCENIDGEADAFCWTKSIAFEEFSEEDILGEIETQKEWLKEHEYFGEQMDEQLKQINYMEDDSDYTQKIPHLKEFAYVCPNCIREIEDCRCKFYPHYLVQIDREMVPIIRELNSKGYKTTGCCAGHPLENETQFINIYICFERDYEFAEPFPEGAKYSKETHKISFECENVPFDEMLEFQRETIWKLSDWTELLFGYDEQEEDDEYDKEI